MSPCSAISLRRLHEAAPGGARQRTADADAAHAEIFGFLQRQAGRADQQVDRLWMHRLHDRGDVLPGLDARRIEAIGARLRIGVQAGRSPCSRSAAPTRKRFAAAGQQHAAVVGIDRLARRLDALDRQRALIQRLGRVAGGILDRQAGDAGLDRARDIGGDLVRLVREAALEIGIDGQIDRRAQRGEMIADVVDA